MIATALGIWFIASIGIVMFVMIGFFVRWMRAQVNTVQRANAATRGLLPLHTFQQLLSFTDGAWAWCLVFFLLGLGLGLSWLLV